MIKSNRTLSTIALFRKPIIQAGHYSAHPNGDIAATDQLFEASCELLFGSIKSILVT